MSRQSALIATAVTGLTIGVPAAQAQDQWNFHLTPYIWGAGIDGTIGVGGRDVDVDADFGDLAEFADSGGSIRFEASKGKWAGFADYFGVTLTNEQSTPFGRIDSESKQVIAEAGVSYRVAAPTELLAGVRYQSVDNKIDFPQVGRISDDNNWTDGFVGARWTPLMTDKWGLWLRGDIGAGGSNFTWLATAGAGYRFNKTVGILAAYRHLQTDYEDGDFKWDVGQKGLGVGLDFAW